MKKYFILLLLLISTFCLNAVAQNKWIEDQEMNFKISIPSDYQVNQMWDGTDKIHAFVSPDQNVAVRVRALKVPDNVNIDLIKQVFANNIINGSKEIISNAYQLNGMDGTMAGYKWKYNRINVVAGAFFTIQKGIAYIIWSLVPENLISQRNAEADAITNSFTLLNSGTSSMANTGGLGGLGGLGGQTQAPNNQAANVRVNGILTGSATTTDKQVTNPTTLFEPTANTIHVAYEYTGNAKGKTMITKLFNETSGAFIKDVPFFPPDAPSGNGYARLDAPGGIWDEGRYRVEVWLNNEKLNENWFDVVNTNSNSSTSTTTNTRSTPAGYFSIVSDDACIEFIAPNGYQVQSSEVGQTIWSDGNGINLVQQTIIKQSDFDSFINEQANNIINHGARIGKKEFYNVNGLRACQYFYEYGSSFFAYVATENNNVFLLLGFAGNMSKHNTAIEYSNALLNNLQKSNCQY